MKTLPLHLTLFLPLLLSPSSSQSTANCDSTQSQWSYTLKTDDYPWETSFRLLNLHTNTLLLSAPTSGTFDRRTVYSDSLCLSPGQYRLVLSDEMGDGFCCNYGRGRWTMTLDGTVVGRKMAGKFDVMEMDFVVEEKESESGFVWVEAVSEPTTVAAVTTMATEAVTTTMTTTTPDLTTLTTQEDTTVAAETTTTMATIITTTTPILTSEEPTVPTIEVQEEVILVTVLPEIEATTTTTTIPVSETTSTATTAAFEETKPPTTSPTVDPWENYNPNHSKFCGPKVVGGYAQAISTCGPLTVCGLVTSSDHYGANGNDCPKGFMCFSDIVCQNTPDSSGDETNESVLNVNGRMNGGVKSMEVHLKQDGEKSRLGVGELDGDGALDENASGTSTTTWRPFVSFIFVFGSWFVGLL